MKRINRIRYRPLLGLVLLCLFLVQSCRKDNVNPNEQPSNDEKQQSAILKWIAENPVSQILSTNLEEAKQAKVKGNKIVRIPVQNVDKTSLLYKNTDLRMNTQSSTASSRGNNSSTQTSAFSSGQNPNNFASHPPELFFMTDNSSDKLKIRFFNFIPKDPHKEFGQDSIWTGTLYQWNLTGDTLLVQEIVKNKLITRYGLRPPPDEKTISLSVKGDSKVLNLHGKKISSFFGWLSNLGGNIAGWIAHTLGFGATYLNSNSGYGSGWRIDWVSSGGGGGGSGSGGGAGSGGGSGKDIDSPVSDYITDSDLISDYMPGYGEAGGVYTPYPIHGPNAPGQVILSASAAYLIAVLQLNNVGQMDYLGNNLNLLATETLAEYLRINGETQENKDFVRWAVMYLTGNEGIVSFEVFKSQFLGTPQGQDGPVNFNENYWNDPNLVIAIQTMPGFSAFSSAYPKNSTGTVEMDAASVYQLIGGEIKALKDESLSDANPDNDGSYSNACALRVSRALNYSGVNIPNLSGPFKGSDGKNYFLSASALNAWMTRAFPPTSANSLKLTGGEAGVNGSGFANALNGKKGIYIMIPNYPGLFGATGHAGLHINPPVTHYYLNAPGGVNKITLWILN